MRHGRLDALRLAMIPQDLVKAGFFLMTQVGNVDGFRVLAHCLVISVHAHPERASVWFLERVGRSRLCIRHLWAECPSRVDSVIPEMAGLEVSGPELRRRWQIVRSLRQETLLDQLGLVVLLIGNSVAHDLLCEPAQMIIHPGIVLQLLKRSRTVDL